MERLLITGASGFLGWNLCRAARECFSVVGTMNTHRPEIPGGRVHAVDLRERDEIERLIETTRPDAVIHTAAEATPNVCEHDPAGTWRINVGAAAHLAEVCGRRDIPLIFTSTDLVFDGLHAPYGEAAPTCPVSEYGRQKALAEHRVLDQHPGALVCRMPLMFGNPGPFGRSFIHPYLDALRQGRTLALFDDEFRSLVCGSVAANGILLALNRGVRGILNLGGTERISRYRFGVLLAEVFGLDPRPIVRARQKDSVQAAARPPDVSLDSGRAFAMGYAPGPLRDQLVRLRGDLACGAPPRADAQPGSP